MKNIATITTEFMEYCKQVANDCPRTTGSITTYMGNIYHNLTSDQIYSLTTQQEAFMRDAWEETRRYTAWLQGYGRTPKTEDLLKWMRANINYKSLKQKSA